MSDSLASSEIISKPIDAGVRRGGAVFKRRIPMRFSLIAAILPALVVCNTATAQVSGMASPTPTMGATSPLGLGTGSAVSQTGIPLGATEIASPGVSPAPTVTGTIAMPSSSTTCSTLGTSPSSMFGSTASFDGGGMAAGSAAPATAATSGPSMSGMPTSTSGISTTSGMLETSGMSGMCGSGSSSMASSSTSPTTPGGGARTGIPFGSTEIGNLGVSSAAAVPMISVLPTVGTVGSSTPLIPTMPIVTPPPIASSTTASTVGNTFGTRPGSNPSGSTLNPTGPGS